MTGAITGFTVDMIEAENVKLSIRKVLSVKLEPKKGRSTQQTETYSPSSYIDTYFMYDAYIYLEVAALN